MPVHSDVTSARFDRAAFVRLAALAGGAPLLAACGSKSSVGGSRPPIAEEPGNLLIFDYAGNDDPHLWRSYAKRFPHKKPKWSYIASDDQAYAKLVGGFRPDVVLPCVNLVPDYVAADLIQPWDTSLLKTFPDLNKTFVEAGKIKGKQYFLPAQWGYSSVLYRADKVRPQPNSYGLLWDKRYSGKISWYDSLEMLAMAAYAKGIQDPWNMSDSQLNEVKQTLESGRSYVRNLWSSTTDFVNDLKAGNTWLGYAWPDSYILAKQQGLDVVYMQPREGRISYVCGFVLMKNTKNYYHAHAYVDSWLSPEAGLYEMANFGFGHTNTSIDLAKLPKAIVNVFHLDNPDAVGPPLAHLHPYVRRRGAYNKVWGQVKGS
jgi:spermidine/putrescine transport system substrate-binding protein